LRFFEQGNGLTESVSCDTIKTVLNHTDITMIKENHHGEQICIE